MKDAPNVTISSAYETSWHAPKSRAQQSAISIRHDWLHCITKSMCRSNSFRCETTVYRFVDSPKNVERLNHQNIWRAHRCSTAYGCLCMCSIIAIDGFAVVGFSRFRQSLNEYIALMQALNEQGEKLVHLFRFENDI